MKKLIAVLVAVVVLGTGFCGVSYAGDEGWAAAGGLLGGLILGSAISNNYNQGYYYPAPVYYSAPVYYQRTYPYPVYTTYTTYGGYYPSRRYVECY